MATKKLTPVKPTGENKEAVDTTQQKILEELKKHTEYMHRMDWKLWVIMGMIKLIGEENGYTFKSHSEDNDEEISTPNNINKLVDSDNIPWESKGDEK
jgi:hypothetical protein